MTINGGDQYIGQGKNGVRYADDYIMMPLQPRRLTKWGYHWSVGTKKPVATQPVRS